MKSNIKNVIYLGVSTATAAKRFVESEIKQYADRGHISSKEGKKIADDVMKRVHAHKSQFEKAVIKEVKRGLAEAKPLLKEGKKIAKEITKEIMSEVKSKVKSKAKGAMMKVSRKIKSKVVKARSAAKFAKKKVKSLKIKKRIRKKISRRIKRR